jgi:hypothetical protein
MNPNLLQKIAARLGMGFHRFKQTYSLQVETSFTNPTDRTQIGEYIIPLILEQYHASRLLQLHTPANHTIYVYDNDGNRYIQNQLSLLPHETVSVSYDAIICTAPVYSKSYKNSLADYTDTLTTNSLSIDHTDPKIAELCKSLNVHTMTDVSKIIKTISRYIMEHLEYGDAIDGLYTSRDAIGRKKVDCGGFSTLFCALARASGIPARVVSGFFVSTVQIHNTMHAWAEYQLPNGVWIPVDLDIEQLWKQRRTHKFASASYIGSDRIVTGIGCDFVINIKGGRLDIPIFQHATFTNPAVYGKTQLTTRRTKVSL